jgi:hypothetical protein
VADLLRAARFKKAALPKVQVGGALPLEHHALGKQQLMESKLPGGSQAQTVPLFSYPVCCKQVAVLPACAARALLAVGVLLVGWRQAAGVLWWCRCCVGATA